MTTRVGIVGCGTIGQAHSRSLRAIVQAGLADAAVVAACDTVPERAEAFARAWDAEALADPRALLDRVDAVWIGTPTSSHRALVEAAAARRVAVFCEKPLAPTLADAEAMCSAVSAAGVPAQVGLVLRTAPVFVALRGLVQDGSLGAPMSIVFRDDQFFPIRGHYASTWRADVSVAGAGTLLEHSIHDLDLLTWCLGPVTSVSARTANHAGHVGIEDVAVASLAFSSGALGSLTSVWHDVLTRPSTRRLEVLCREGLVWTEDDWTGPLHVSTSAGDEVRPCPPPAWVADLPLPSSEVGLAVRHYAAANRAFLDAVASGRPPAPGFADGLAAHRLASALYESAEHGGTPVATRC